MNQNNDFPDQLSSQYSVEYEQQEVFTQQQQPLTQDFPINRRLEIRKDRRVSPSKDLLQIGNLIVNQTRTQETSNEDQNAAMDFKPINNSLKSGPTSKGKSFKQLKFMSKNRPLITMEEGRFSSHISAGMEAVEAVNEEVKEEPSSQGIVKRIEQMNVGKMTFKQRFPKPSK